MCRFTVSWSLLVAFVVAAASMGPLDAQDRAAPDSDEPVRLWLVFNLRPVDAGAGLPAVDDVIGRWGAAGIDLRPLRDKARSNPEFLRQLLGQEAVLERLAAFRRSRMFPRIEVQFFGWDEYWDMLRSTAPANRPDLAQIPSSWCSSLAADLGVLAPLTEAEARTVSTGEARFASPCRVDQTTYGVPWLVDVRMLFFWREDLPALESNLQTFPSARDAFRASLRSSPALGSHPPFGLPTARDWELLHLFSLLVWSERGELVRPRGGPGFAWSEAAFEEPARRAAEYLGGLAKDGLIVLPRETRQTLERRFLDHQLGSIVTGPWLFDQLPTASMTSVGVVVPPFYDHDPTTFAGGSLLGLTNRAPRLRSAAWQLAGYLTGDAALPVALASGLVPAADRARGSATAAIHGGATALEGRPCATYFDCLAARTRVPSHVTELDRALRSSRTLPALPVWWELEVPSHLGSLYHFWQELAALQPRQQLDSSLQTVAEDWDAVLTRPRRLRLIAAAVVAIVLLVVVLALYNKRRVDAAAAARLAEALRLEREARRHLQKVQQALWRVASNPSQVQQEIDTVTASSGQPQRPFVVTLPSSHSAGLTITRNGQATGTIELPAMKMIDVLARQALIQTRPVQFSIVTAHMLLWTDSDASITDPLSRLESIVTGMRQAFASKKMGEVIGKGRHTVYPWTLDESKYRCVFEVGGQGLPPKVMDFAVDVCEPFLEASRLRAQDPARALSLAAQALAAERDLKRKDLELVLLVCELARHVEGPMDQVAGEAIASARQELHDAARTYAAFFAVYPSLAHLLKPYKKVPEHPAIVEHYEAFKSTWDRIRGLTSTERVQPQPPKAIESDWTDALRLLAGVNGQTARQILHFVRGSDSDSDEDAALFNDAFVRIVDYWGKATVPPIVDDARRALMSMRLDDRTMDEVLTWTRTSALEGLATLVLDGLRANAFPDQQTTIATAQASLCGALREGLRQKRPLVLLALIDPASPNQQAVIDAVLSEPWPTDLASCLSHLRDARSRPSR
jgi:hypothetical protein